MNYHFEPFPNAMIGGTASSCYLVGWVRERIEKWFRRPDHEQLNRVPNMRLEERRRKRARIARELRDTLFQGFFGACPQLHFAAEQARADSLNKPSHSRVLLLMQRVIDEGREALQGLRSSAAAFVSLEHAFSGLRDELVPSDVQFRVFVMGKSKELKPAVQEQIFLIGREALLNALRHSEATNIEAEVEYLPRQLRLVVRDDGCGIDSQVVGSGRNAHWGLQGMRERARSIGAQLRIWSRQGAGTEVEISVPSGVAINAQA